MSVTLAAELIHRTIWYPTILGILVVFFAIALFAGSMYLLLGTNLGARLGFLVAFTALAGFMVVLSSLWMSTASPLNTLKGRIPSWKVQEIVAAPTKAKAAPVQHIQRRGRTVNVIEASNVKAAVDAALVTLPEIPAQGKLPPGTNKYAEFSFVTDYKILTTLETGGGKPNPLNFELTHKPLYAVAHFCEVEPPDPIKYPFGVAPPKNPACLAGSTKSGWIVLERDLGSVRVPPIVAFVASVLFFILGLLLLHWREQDEQAAERASSTLVPARVES